MESSATLRRAAISAQKARLVADQIRGLPVESALEVLVFSNKKGAAVVRKVLESAIANAEHNEGADIDELTVACAASERRVSSTSFSRAAMRARASVS